MRRMMRRLYIRLRIQIRLIRLHFLVMPEPEDAKSSEQMLAEIKKALKET